MTTNWLSLCLLFLHLTVVTVLIPKIILQRRESGATLAWILVIIFLPFLGMLRRKRHRAEQHLVPSRARFRTQQKLTDTDELVASSLHSPVLSPESLPEKTKASCKY